MSAHAAARVGNPEDANQDNEVQQQDTTAAPKWCTADDVERLSLSGTPRQQWIDCFDFNGRTVPGMTLAGQPIDEVALLRLRWLDDWIEEAAPVRAEESEREILRAFVAQRRAS